MLGVNELRVCHYNCALVDVGNKTSMPKREPPAGNNGGTVVAATDGPKESMRGWQRKDPKNPMVPVKAAPEPIPSE